MVNCLSRDNIVSHETMIDMKGIRGGGGKSAARNQYLWGFYYLLIHCCTKKQQLAKISRYSKQTRMIYGAGVNFLLQQVGITPLQMFACQCRKTDWFLTM